MLYFSNIAFFILIGFCEALMWHELVNKISRLTAKRLHYPLVFIRLLWFGLIAFVTNYDMATMIPLVMCYPFWHLGSLYQFRHWLNPSIYQYGFFSNASSSSTSVWDRILPMDWQFRTMLFVVGTMFYILWNL